MSSEKAGVSLDIIERAMSSLKQAAAAAGGVVGRVPSPVSIQQQASAKEEEEQQQQKQEIQQEIDQMGPDEEIPFDPTKVSDIDIVASKIRTYNNKYPGNQFYVKLVHEKVEGLEFEDISEYRRVAMDIVHVLLDLRGGRFLKLKDGGKNHTTCTVSLYIDITIKHIRNECINNESSNAPF